MGTGTWPYLTLPDLSKMTAPLVKIAANSFFFFNNILCRFENGKIFPSFSKTKKSRLIGRQGLLCHFTHLSYEISLSNIVVPRFQRIRSKTPKLASNLSVQGWGFQRISVGITVSSNRGLSLCPDLRSTIA